MKGFFKFLTAALTVAFLTLTSFTLAGCGGQVLELESDVSQKLFDTENYMVANVYSQQLQTDFDSDVSEHFVTNSNYYVLISSKAEEDILQVKLNQVTYEKGQDVTIKVSATNSIKRKAFFKQDNNFYLSSLLIFLNTDNTGHLVISYPKNKYKDSKIKIYQGENNLNISPQSMMAGEISTVDENNLIFNFKIDNNNGKIFVKITQNNQPLLEAAPILIEVVANPSMSNQSSSYKFEMPVTVGELEGMGVVITPGFNGGDEYEIGLPENHTIIYGFYVPKVGVKKITLKFFNTKQ